MGPLQWQIYCRRQKPIPFLLQSVESTVGRLVSNDFIPFLTACEISLLLASKQSFSSWVQTKSVFGLKSLLKGAIISVLENAHVTCSTKPNQDLIPEMFSGLGKFKILCNNASQGSTPSFINLKPKYSSSCFPRTNFFLFIKIPPFPHMVRYLQVLKNSSSRLESHRMESSTSLLWSWNPRVTSSNLWQYPSPEDKKPCGTVR